MTEQPFWLDLVRDSVLGILGGLPDADGLRARASDLFARGEGVVVFFVPTDVAGKSLTGCRLSGKVLRLSPALRALDVQSIVAGHDVFLSAADATTAVSGSADGLEASP